MPFQDVSRFGALVFQWIPLEMSNVAQGTNAHMVMGEETTTLLCDRVIRPQHGKHWHHSRYWHTIDPHALLHTVSLLHYAKCIQSACRLEKAVLASLQQNKVCN